MKLTSLIEWDLVAAMEGEVIENRFMFRDWVMFTPTSFERGIEEDFYWKAFLSNDQSAKVGHQPNQVGRP